MSRNRSVNQAKPLILDATGRFLHDDPLSISDLLTSGSEAEVRQELDYLGSAIENGWPLPQKVAAWMGRALREISRGKCANEALRIKGNRNASLRSTCILRHQVDDLKAQGASEAKALALIASDELTAEINGQARQGGPTEDEARARAGTLRKRLHKKARK